MQNHSTRGSKFCKGFSALTGCFFSISQIGKPACKEAKGTKCLFCDLKRMTTACNSVKGRSNITKALKAFGAHYEPHGHVYNAAMMRVPDEWRERFYVQVLKEKAQTAPQCRGSPARENRGGGIENSFGEQKAVLFGPRPPKAQGRGHCIERCWAAEGSDVQASDL